MLRFFGKKNNAANLTSVNAFPVRPDKKWEIDFEYDSGPFLSSMMATPMVDLIKPVNVDPEKLKKISDKLKLEEPIVVEVVNDQGGEIKPSKVMGFILYNFEYTDQIPSYQVAYDEDQGENHDLRYPGVARSIIIPRVQYNAILKNYIYYRNQIDPDSAKIDKASLKSYSTEELLKKIEAIKIQDNQYKDNGLLGKQLKTLEAVDSCVITSQTNGEKTYFNVDIKIKSGCSKESLAQLSKALSNAGLIPEDKKFKANQTLNLKVNVEKSQELNYVIVNLNKNKIEQKEKQTNKAASNNSNNIEKKGSKSLLDYFNYNSSKKVLPQNPPVDNKNTNESRKGKWFKSKQ